MGATHQLQEIHLGHHRKELRTILLSFSYLKPCMDSRIQLSIAYYTLQFWSNTSVDLKMTLLAQTCSWNASPQKYKWLTCGGIRTGWQHSYPSSYDFIITSCNADMDDVNKISLESRLVLLHSWPRPQEQSFWKWPKSPQSLSNYSKLNRASTNYCYI